MTSRSLSAGALAGTARRLYRDAPFGTRVLQGLRPYICPFDALLRWIPANAHMLDVGCGAGLFLGFVGEMRPDVSGIGFDANAGVIAAARTMARSNFAGDRIRFQHLTVQEAWPEGAFDVVSIIDVLHHIPPAAQRAVIEQAFAHVRPGGVLIYKDMADGSPLHAWWNRLHDLLMARQWIHYLPLEHVERWLEAAGANMLAIDRQKRGPYDHEWIVAARPA